MLRRERILGIPILAGKREEMLKEIADLVSVGGVVATLNPEIMAMAFENRELYRVLRESVNVPDGIGVVKELSSRGTVSSVYPGVELGEDILKGRRLRLGIIGGREGVAKRALRRLSEKHNGVVPLFAESGYGITEKRAEEMIGRMRPDVVFVCLGAPKQELFSFLLHRKFQGVLFLALGGSVDVYSGDVRRAPLLLRRMHLEWLFRIAREPSRIFRFKRSLSFFRYARLEKRGKLHKITGKTS